MRVTILKKRIKHDGKAYVLNQNYDIPEVLANDWINAGYASEVQGQEETPEVEPPTDTKRTTRRRGL